MQPVSSWGRLSAEPHEVIPLVDRPGVAARLAARTPGIAFGNGRSYGDVCLNPAGVLWRTRGLDRFIAFDRSTGRLEAESGVLLGEVISLALPHGWFLPVTPGTRQVTLGGAVANDVHGKNHHRAGTFGEHVPSLVLRRTDGERIECGPERRAEWFRATVGGLGLTGVIESLTLQLQPVTSAWVRQWTTPFQGLDAFFACSADASAEHAYTVAWIDAGSARDGEPRGILFAGDHAAEGPPRRERAAPRVPFTPPFSLVRPTSVRLFDALYHRRHRARPSPQLVHHRPFFYPLDGVLDWNRLYGPRGFFQYQCVLPRAAERDAMRELLRRIARARAGSFLGVLKTFEARPSAGLLSFPMAGTTLAIDLPNAGDATRALFDLDAVVAAAGGRLYAAKDGRMPAALFRAGYPELAAFEAYRDPGISSAMSRRLLGR